MGVKVTGKTPSLVAATFALLSFLSVDAAQRQPQASEQPGSEHFSIDPEQSQVHWTLGTTLHTVHGTFALTRGEVQLDPNTGKAGGEIVVDARSAESGNESRDKKMHREILESGKFAQILFRPQRIEGKLTGDSASLLQVHGVFVLHGAEHEMDLPVEAKISGQRWSGIAKFKVPYIQWGLKNPSTFLLKVKSEVEIEMELAGSLLNTRQ